MFKYPGKRIYKEASITERGNEDKSKYQMKKKSQSPLQLFPVINFQGQELFPYCSGIRLKLRAVSMHFIYPLN